MHLSLLEWIVTVTVTVAVLTLDMTRIARHPHEPTMAECALALAGYVLLAVLFGVSIWVGHGSRYGMQFFAGWLTEYSLSVDNLFVFILIIASFGVPKRDEQGVLFVGILLALVFRGVFITLGGVAVQHVSWVFYVFAVFIVYVGVRMGRGAGHGSGGHNAVVRFARNHLNTTGGWDGVKLYIKAGGRRTMTPMFLVVLAVAGTDVMFAMDSISAVYGLTTEPYLVFAANVFALMGLRQLYFLLGGMLQRLVYLSYGLMAILLFIAVKMILQALRQNELSLLNGGNPFDVPKISTAVSLTVIAAVLVATTVASLYRTRVVDADNRQRC